MKHLCLFIILNCTIKLAYSQLQIKLIREPDKSIAEIFTKENGGIDIIECKYVGHPQSIGYFINNTSCFGIANGLVLSTGFVNIIATPNVSGNSSGSMGTSGDIDLSLIARGKTFDAAVVYIDFISKTDTIVFEYFFGSEEYPEYLNKGVNDVFAFFIRKKGAKTWRNIAYSPTGFPISIDNINSIKNSEYYIQNHYYTPEFREKTDKDEIRDLAAYFTFDGFTKPMRAISKVEKEIPYELKIAIADVGDDIYDSGVFLTAKSFQALNYIHKKGIALSLPIALNKLSGMNELYSYTEENNKLTISLFPKFSFNSYEIDSISKPVLDTIISQLQTIDNPIVLYGHTDSIGSNKYNQELSLRRAQTVAKYLTDNQISPIRIKTIGMGATQPKISNTTEHGRMINRRVDIEIALEDDF